MEKNFLIICRLQFWAYSHYQMQNSSIKRRAGFLLQLAFFLLIAIPGFSQQQITENLKCTYLGNSFGGGKKWVQNYIDNMNVTKDGTVNTNSVWDEAHHEWGIYTKCDVIGNKNMKTNSLKATDCNGNIWTVENKGLRFMEGLVTLPTGANAPYIKCTDGREIRTIIDPSAIAVDNQCRLLVADNGPDQNIKVFDISRTGTPVPVDTIGVTGGAMGGAVRGQTGPLKFWGIRGLGTDSLGNLWVGSCGFPSQVGGGLDLRHFNTSLEMDCQMLDLNFVASMDADPTDPTQIYSHEEHHEIDYNAVAGDFQSHWKYKSVTIDPFTYPDDPRITISLESVFMRYIDGKKYMFLTDMYQQFIIVYRFEGEIAIPSAFFCVAWDGQWDKYTWQIDKRPKWSDSNTRRWLWRDNNGDGQVQKDEFSIYDLGYPYVKGLDIDKNGNVFIGSRKLIYFPTNGLDGNGVPNYSVTTLQKTDSPYESPTQGGDMTRIEYVDETDVMYFGFDGEFPNFKKIVRYKNWSKGERNGDTLLLGKQAVTFAADDKYIYTNVGSAGKYTAKNGEIDVWDAETLLPVGYILPGAEVFGESGWLDLGYALKVSRLPSGERVIIAEEDWKGKNTVYIWCPDGDCAPIDFSITLTSPKPDTAYMNNGNVVFEATVNPGSSVISKVEFYADNLLIGEDSSNPYSFSWVNPNSGTHMVYARAVEQGGKTSKSNYFGLKITDGNPEIYLQSPSAGYNYTLLDTVVFFANAFDYNGSIQNVEFFSNGISIGKITEAPFRLAWNKPEAGQYEIYAKATDNDGNDSITPTIAVKISDEFNFSFVSPVSNTMLNEGADFDVQLDPGTLSSLKSITYYNDTSLLITTSTEPYLYSITNAKAGIYNLSAFITLNDDRIIKSKGPTVFVLSSIFDCEHTGMMNLDLWNNVDGSTISKIPLGDVPSESRMVNIFEGPINIADSYGERICGYICPPQTGPYTFWTSGDDNNQFSIRLPEEDTFRIIAFVDGWTSSRAWDNMPSQKSEPIVLQAGQMYLVEGLLKEGGGDDNFAVGWQLPDGTLERPIPGNHIIPLYNPLTLNNEVSVNIISPVNGTKFSTKDTIEIIAEVLKGGESISLMRFFTGGTKLIGEDKTPEANTYSFSSKFAKGNYKLTARGTYKNLIIVPSNEVSITVSVITSVLEDVSDEGFEVYPNPLSDGPLTVKMPENAKKLSVFDVTGNLIYQTNIMKNEISIDESVFQSRGVYVVKVLTSKNSLNRKVIITK
jgi:hypothetical protein